MRAALAALLAVSLAAGAGCASAPAPTAGQNLPTVREATTVAGHGRDLRGACRQALCRHLAAAPAAAAAADCEEVLLRLPGEPVARPHATSASSASLATRYRIAFVPGLFADCTEEWLMPFSDASEVLRAAGFDVAMLRIAGRAGTEQNAAQLAREIAALPNDGKRLIVFAYSKGLPDVLDLLVRHPTARPRIAAVVSYAGAFNGSPLADDLRGVYAAFVANLPLNGCAAGTGAELEALRPAVRQAWWRAHQAELRATHIPFFSVVGAPRPDRVSPLLRSNHNRLAELDPTNDSQLLAADAILPGSAPLGYVNADHWSIAIPLSHQLPALASLFRDDLPRGALVSAAIEVVDQTIAPSPVPLDKP